MAVITLPDAVIATAGGLTYGQQRYDLTDESPVTGSAFVMPMGPPRWTASLRSKQAMALRDAGWWESMVTRLRGGINHLALYDLLRPLPAGTLRGTPKLLNNYAIGAAAVSLRGGVVGANLLQYTQAFSGDAWSGFATVTDNTTAAPNGVTSADTLTDSDSGSTAVREQTVTVPDDTATYTASVHVRKTSGGTSPTFRLRLSFDGGGTPIFTNVHLNSDTGAVLAGPGSAVSVDSNWWRVQVQLANNGTGNTSATVQVIPASAPNGSTTGAASTTGSAILWGVQLERAASASAYTGLGTLLAGDWVQIGSGMGTSQLVKLVADATESAGGTTIITFEPALRLAFSSGDLVTLERPLGYYKLRNPSSTWQAVPNGPAIDGFALDLLEQWA